MDLISSQSLFQAWQKSPAGWCHWKLFFFSLGGSLSLSIFLPVLNQDLVPKIMSCLENTIVKNETLFLATPMDERVTGGR